MSRYKVVFICVFRFVVSCCVHTLAAKLSKIMYTISCYCIRSQKNHLYFKTVNSLGVNDSIFHVCVCECVGIGSKITSQDIYNNHDKSDTKYHNFIG